MAFFQKPYWLWLPHEWACFWLYASGFYHVDECWGRVFLGCLEGANDATR